MDAVSEHRQLVAGNVIEGVQVRTLKVARDGRGSFTEVFYDSWGCCIEPRQWSVVASHRGVLRGMHLHRRHDEYFSVLSGRTSVGLKDLRPDSPTFAASSLYELSGDQPAVLTFPRGILHGWYFHAETLHLQAVSETYDDYHGDDNLGCHWSDPELGIPWPERPTLVAERADAFPPLRTLLVRTAELARPDEPWFGWEPAI